MSERFESDFYLYQVKTDNCIFLKDMKETIFGMWCAHKFGRIKLNNDYKTTDSFMPVLFTQIAIIHA